MKYQQERFRMIDASQWENFYLKDIFEINYGNKLDLCNLFEVSTNDSNAVSFVSRTAQNNGVSSYVERLNIKPFPKGSLTVALGGSLGETFLQTSEFYTGQNVAVLLPKKGISDNLSDNQKLFIAMLIKYETSLRFIAFGRELNKHIKTDFSIKLPVISKNKPDWEWIENYMNGLAVKIPRTKNLILKHEINTGNWHFFKVGQLFKLEAGKVSSTEVLTEGEDIFYCGAKKDENGIMSRCAYDKKYISKGNCIVFICDGQGAVGYNNYMDRDFIATVNLVRGYNDNLNKYNGLFLVSLLDLERPKFSFGRKRKKTLANTEIKLPAKLNSKNEYEPDWQYMEDYIKSLPYGDVI